MFSVATVFLLLASLVAAAGFAVVAQRRLRQLGMLAAVGATGSTCVSCCLTNGAVVGTIAAVIGTIVGLGAVARLAPTLESAVDHRIDRLSLRGSWSRWPVCSRSPAQPPPPGGRGEPSPASRSCSRSRADRRSRGRHATRPSRPRADRGRHRLSRPVGPDQPPLIIAGLLATILGSLLLGPLAIRTSPALAGRVPVAPRLALRDLARYQARSGRRWPQSHSRSASQRRSSSSPRPRRRRAASEPASLSDRQIRIYSGPPEVRRARPASRPHPQLDRLAAGCARVAAQLTGRR